MAERFREHLGRLAGHVVRGYKKVVGPRAVVGPRNLVRVQELINAGVLKPFYKSKVEQGTSLNFIMRDKMSNWKERLGIVTNRQLRNKYGNLGNIRVLKRIRNNARKAQNNKNTGKKMNNARRYIQTLSVNNLRQLLTPSQLKALSRGNTNANALQKMLRDARERRNSTQERILVNKLSTMGVF